MIIRTPIGDLGASEVSASLSWPSPAEYPMFVSTCGVFS